MIETRPSRADKIAALFFVIFFTFIGAVPLWILIMYPYMNSLSARPPLVLMVFALVPGFLFGIYYARKTWDKVNWRLTESELACGKFRKQVFPFSSVQMIILGLPTGKMGRLLKQDKPGSAVGTGLDALAVLNPTANVVRQVYVPLRENSLLLCFADGSWLPLCLYQTPNGESIMEALKERFKERLVWNHEYSPEERKRLRSRDINELIPSPK